ncbi:MAG: nucleoside triphosphate pyrophosphohydrolase [Chthoniobacterales bacterium]|nr:nucleoside triphosphate pyrophosphohydrolase [Chthoniobacterales bacterium]MDQ3119045.1 nucleoside triphosphate pyrophosphohydrolase [Verrucomicrobiota bacterium]
MDNSTPPALDPQLAGFVQLCAVVARLRAPDGCPWDREQTNESLVPKLLEEAYEVAEAIRERDDTNLREELGDVMLLIAMHAQIASERGGFSMEEVLRDITTKLIRRHPHVFGGSEAHDAGAVVKLWDSVKRAEKKDEDSHYLTGVAKALPALMRAQKIQKKAAHVNFDWDDIADVVAKVDEELAETKEALDDRLASRIAEELGDLLFAVVNLARRQKLEAETLLQSATDKFVRRFHALEDELKDHGRKLGEVELAELDAIWNAQKIAARL